jgi:type 1 glutamine amidotransferase
MSMTARNLILTGGLYHPFEAASRTLAEVLGEVGFVSDITTDVHAGLAALAEGRYDLLTVFALRWPMKDPRFDADRERWGVQLTAADKAAIEGHMERGRGVLALHTAAICFDDWPRWREIVGAGWAWGRSSHPPHGPASVRITDDTHPITLGLQGFEFEDEAYSNMDLVPGIEALATVRAPSQEREWPCLWARELNGTRVAYDALGHDSASLQHPTHRRIVQRAALWCTRRETQSSPSLPRTE